MHKPVIIAMLLAASPAAAQESMRIHDWSLPPDQSLQLPNVNNHPNPYEQFPNQGGWSGGGSSAVPPDSGNGLTPQARFMDAYCDPNFKPALAENGKLSDMQSCLAQQKQRQCAAFQQLPADAQRVVDEAADCMFNARNGDDDTQAKPADCSASDAPRLQMLRRYGQNQAVAHALESLPEEIAGASAACLRGGR